MSSATKCPFMDAISPSLESLVSIRNTQEVAGQKGNKDRSVLRVRAKSVCECTHLCTFYLCLMLLNLISCFIKANIYSKILAGFFL